MTEVNLLFQHGGTIDGIKLFHLGFEDTDWKGLGQGKRAVGSGLNNAANAPELQGAGGRQGRGLRRPLRGFRLNTSHNSASVDNPEIERAARVYPRGIGSMNRQARSSSSIAQGWNRRRARGAPVRRTVHGSADLQRLEAHPGQERILISNS